MKKIQIILLILLTGFVAVAQQDLSLNQAIEKALENNYQMKIMLNNQRVAEIENNWGDAGRYPYINLSLGDNNSFNMVESENYTNNRFSGDASVSWTIFDGFSVKINKQRFEELEEMSKQNTAIMVENTIQSVILAYYSVLLEKEKLDVYEEVMKLSEDRYEQAKYRKEFGTYVTYDVLQAQNSYLADHASFLLQQVAFKNAQRDLNYLMAEDASATYTLTETFEAIPVDYTKADLEAQMFENNKSLKNQYINQRLIENAVAAAKSAFAPSVGFNGGLSGNSARTSYVDSGSNWNQSASLYGNFTLSFNLFSGGKRKRAVQIAQIDEQTGMVRIDEMKHDLKNSLSNIFEYYLVRKELLTVADENLVAAQLNMQISKEKFESGAINSFNYRDVQAMYLNSALAKLQAIYNFIDTHTSLLQLTGTIIQEYE